jgi:hypothetical protein
VEENKLVSAQDPQIVAPIRASVKTSEVRGVIIDPQTTELGRGRYYADPATRRWRRKGAPQNARPDLRHVILTSPTLEGSHLTVREVEHLFTLIQPALERRYGDRFPDERSF